MCGITGQLNFNNKSIDRTIFKKMNNLILHRGPDDFGYYFNNNLALGNVRLSIFDTSNNGHMPMKSKDGRFVISYNGEVYNWKEIRKDLKFNNWRSETDTETILYAYIEKGPECLKLFRGMFTISIWDNKKKEIFIARDREGIKPLYYFKSSEKIIFSSEIKSIIRSGVNKKIDYGELYNFLRWGLIDHSKKTLFKNIYQLEPGCYLRSSTSNNLKIQRYYSLKNEIFENQLNENENIEKIFFSNLQETIKLYTRSDVKYGTLLSSGTDSSLITSLIKSKLNKNLHTFTYDFKGSSPNLYGESKKTKNFSKKLGIKNHISYLDSKEVPHLFDKMLFYQELPITSLRVLSEFKLNSLAKKLGYSVLISGDGGDHIGGGFKYYWHSIVLDEIKNKGVKAGKLLQNKFLDHFKIKNKKNFISNSVRATINPGTTTTDGVPYFNILQYEKNFLKLNEKNKFNFERPFKSNLLNFQYIDLTYHNLPRVLRMKDRASMANGVEMRVPLLDSKMVKFSFNLKHYDKVKGVQQRYFMIKAANKYLKKINISKTKTSIVDNQREWLKTELRDWVGDAIHSKILNDLGIFDVANVKKSFDIYCKNKITNTSYNFFQIINVVYWYESIFKKKIF